MLFMVIERFKGGNPTEVGHRFAQCGRLMPEDLTYLSSWMSADGAQCFQLMEAPSAHHFESWMSNWSDLVDFEVIEIIESAEFWTRRPNQ